jgi:ubiquitin-conjugating enzyme E2 D
MSSKRRLMRELNEMQSSPPENCSASSIDNNIYRWQGVIIGPENSPYDGGAFKLNIKFSESYPFTPPEVTFVTPVLHPNIDSEGNICLDILKDQWSPALKISKVLLSICSLLDKPNPDDPLSTDIANIYKNNIEEYNNKVRNHVKIHAI